jgi:hypothetical protein
MMYIPRLGLVCFDMPLSHQFPGSRGIHTEGLLARLGDERSYGLAIEDCSDATKSTAYQACMNT